MKESSAPVDTEEVLARRIEKIVEETNLQSIVRSLRVRWKPYSIVLFGSASRGDYSPSSDIDLLMITPDKIRASEVYSSISPIVHGLNLSISIYPLAGFLKLQTEGSLFVAHLFKEGAVLYDDGHFLELRNRPFHVSPRTLLTTCKIIRKNLAIYDDLSIFNGLFAPSLAHLYSMAADLAMIACALTGKLEFRKVCALQMVGEIFPNLTREIQLVAPLNDIWLLVDRGSRNERQFGDYLHQQKVSECVQVVRELSEKVLQLARNS